MEVEGEVARLERRVKDLDAKNEADSTARLNVEKKVEELTENWQILANLNAQLDVNLIKAENDNSELKEEVKSLSEKNDELKKIVEEKDEKITKTRRLALKYKHQLEKMLETLSSASSGDAEANQNMTDESVAPVEMAVVDAATAAAALSDLITALGETVDGEDTVEMMEEENKAEEVEPSKSTAAEEAAPTEKSVLEEAAAPPHLILPPSHSASLAAITKDTVEAMEEEEGNQEGEESLDAVSAAKEISQWTIESSTSLESLAPHTSVAPAEMAVMDADIDPQGATTDGDELLIEDESKLMIVESMSSHLEDDEEEEKETSKEISRVTSASPSLEGLAPPTRPPPLMSLMFEQFGTKPEASSASAGDETILQNFAAESVAPAEDEPVEVAASAASAASAAALTPPPRPQLQSLMSIKLPQLFPTGGDMRKRGSSDAMMGGKRWRGDEKDGEY